MSLDDDNRVTSVTNGDIYVAYTYDEYGRLSDRVVSDDSNAVVENLYAYKTVNGKRTTRISRINHRIADNTISLTSSYTYYEDGNIKEFSYGPRTSTYTYDSAGQLLSEDNPGMKYRYEWTYDAAGNIQTRKEYTYITGEANPVLSKTVIYTYSTSTWGDLLMEYNQDRFIYDGIGNPLHDGTWAYTWEHGRELVQMDGPVTWNFTYDANGMRTKRTNGTDTYTYVYNGSQLTQMTKGNDTLYFTYDASGTPVSVTHSNGSTSVSYYYVTNLQGDVMHLFDANGATAGYYTYDAWGNQISMGSSTICQLNPLRYRGYVYDQETELYYLQSRYYNPEWGRFINADAFVATGQGFVGNNMFAYCNNNPVMYKDPNGKEFILATAGGVAIAALVVCVVAASYCAAKALCEIASYVTTISQTTWAQISYATEELEPPDVTYPGDDPSKAPGDDYEWKGQEPVGGDKGSWVNNKTGEQMHPDLNHDPSVAPHYDYTNGVKPKVWWRVFRDGRIELRK